MNLIAEAGKVFRRAWSVRLSLLSALAQTAFVCWQYFLDKQPHAIILFTAALSMGAAIARIIDQPKLRNGVRTRKTDKRR